MDDDFDLAITISTSSVNSQVTKGMVGGGASGIHGGVVIDFGIDVYVLAK